MIKFFWLTLDKVNNSIIRFLAKDLVVVKSACLSARNIACLSILVRFLVKNLAKYSAKYSSYLNRTQFIWLNKPHSVTIILFTRGIRISLRLCVKC